MKKLIRFILAWTVGVPFVLLALGLCGLMIAIFSLAEDHAEVEDLDRGIRDIFLLWWKWASFSPVK